MSQLRTRSTGREEAGQSHLGLQKPSFELTIYLSSIPHHHMQRLQLSLWKLWPHPCQASISVPQIPSVTRRQCQGTKFGNRGFAEGGTHKETLHPQDREVIWGFSMNDREEQWLEGSANGRQGLGSRVLLMADGD